MSVLPVRRRTPKENFQKKKNVTLRSFPRYANRSSLYRVAQVFLCVHLIPEPQPPAPSSRPRTALRRLKSRPVAPPRPPARPLHQAHPGPLRTSSGPSRVLPQTASVHWRGGWRHHLRDTASVGFFVMVLSLVAAGSAPVERLMAAYVAADRSRGKAQKPGAIFVSVWSGWQPPLKPSEINRPVYYQADRGCDPVISSPAPPPGGDELSREEEIMTLRDILSRPHGPFARVARVRLAELGAAPDPI